MSEIVPVPPSASLVPLDDLEVKAAFLLRAPESEEADDLLAQHIYQIWQQRGELHHAVSLNVGKWIHHYCQRKLWLRSGYSDFKETWDAEGIPGVDYTTAKGWQYEWECSKRAGLTDDQAAHIPSGKLLAANATLRRAQQAGDDCSEMIGDLANPGVSQRMWEDRYKPPRADRLGPDRATIDSRSGAIFFWTNTMDADVGIRMGTGVVEESAEWAWQQIIEGKAKLEWA